MNKLLIGLLFVSSCGKAFTETQKENRPAVPAKVDVSKTGNNRYLLSKGYICCATTQDFVAKANELCKKYEILKLASGRDNLIIMEINCE